MRTTHTADRLRETVSSLPDRLRDPITQSDLLQIVKTVTAAVVAWVLAVRVFGLAQPFLAPWAAMLTVHATVYRSLSRGTQQVAATVLGVLLSFALAELLGVGAATLAAALLLALLLARIGLLRDEGVTVATTALFVLTTGYSQQEEMLGDRILDTLLGISVGVVVNLLVVPPLNDRSAEEHVRHIDRRLGELLADMAEAVRRRDIDEDSEHWLERTRDLDRDLDHAWQIVRHAKESWRFNLRGFHPRYRGRRPTGYENVLFRLEDGVVETRSMARTIRESTVSAHEWDARFRETWLDLISELGDRIADPERDVASLRERVDALRHELSVRELPDLYWPVYGALLVNVGNIIDVVDDVASAQPVST